MTVCRTCSRLVHVVLIHLTGLKIWALVSVASGYTQTASPMALEECLNDAFSHSCRITREAGVQAYTYGVVRRVDVEGRNVWCSQKKTCPHEMNIWLLRLKDESLPNLNFSFEITVHIWNNTIEIKISGWVTIKDQPSFTVGAVAVGCRNFAYFTGIFHSIGVPCFIVTLNKTPLLWYWKNILRLRALKCLCVHMVYSYSIWE